MICPMCNTRYGALWGFCWQCWQAYPLSALLDARGASKCLTRSEACALSPGKPSAAGKRLRSLAESQPRR